MVILITSSFRAIKFNTSGEKKNQSTFLIYLYRNFFLKLRTIQQKTVIFFQNGDSASVEKTERKKRLKPPTN